MADVGGVVVEAAVTAIADLTSSEAAREATGSEGAIASEVTVDPPVDMSHPVTHANPRGSLRCPNRVLCLPRKIFS